MYYFRLPLVDIYLLANEWVPLITFIWLLGMSQAINLIDGLDGLAAGIVAIGATAFFLYSRQLELHDFLAEPNIGPLMSIIAVGVCVGFLPHNFNPAKIFMGDGGAFLLGLLMATSTSVVGGRTQPQQRFFGQSYFFFAPLFIPLLILGVPVLDTLFAIVRRASRGRSFATADKGHLHHRLMNLGHGQRRSVLILWLWTALLSALVLYPVYTNNGASLAVIGIVALGLGLFTVLHPEARRTRRTSVVARAEHHPAQSVEAVPGAGLAHGGAIVADGHGVLSEARAEMPAREGSAVSAAAADGASANGELGDRPLAEVAGVDLAAAGALTTDGSGAEAAAASRTLAGGDTVDGVAADDPANSTRR
jgi:UDP-GlcNAc:undecaprenyl-phosphate GlcNAc-1-phosphate transferase